MTSPSRRCARSIPSSDFPVAVGPRTTTTALLHPAAAVSFTRPATVSFTWPATMQRRTSRRAARRQTTPALPRPIGCQDRGRRFPGARRPRPSVRPPASRSRSASAGHVAGPQCGDDIVVERLGARVEVAGPFEAASRSPVAHDEECRRFGVRPIANGLISGRCGRAVRPDSDEATGASTPASSAASLRPSATAASLAGRLSTPGAKPRSPRSRPAAPMTMTHPSRSCQ